MKRMKKRARIQHLKMQTQSFSQCRIRTHAVKTTSPMDSAHKYADAQSAMKKMKQHKLGGSKESI